MILSVRQQFTSLLENEFDKNVKDRLFIIADVEKYKYKEDKSVWKQKRDLEANYFSVYIDNEYICGFSEKDDPKKAMLEFWKGFKKAYSEGRVGVTKFQSDEIKREKELKDIESKKAIKKAVDSLDESTPTRKMAKEVVKRANKKDRSSSTTA